MTGYTHTRNGQGAIALIACGIIAAAALLRPSQAPAAGTLPPGVSDEGAPSLPPCTRYDEAFENLFADMGEFNDWPEKYESIVEALIQEHMTKAPPADCNAETVGAPPGEELKAIAAKLPAWQDSDAFARLAQGDLPAVLLEFLRVYECALIEHEFALPAEVSRDVAPDTPFLYFQEVFRRWEVMAHELLTARPTMERLLPILIGTGRRRPLAADFECLQLLSLDIRNLVALSAETSACLPRIWDAQDPLREFPECNDGEDNDEDGQSDLADDSCASRMTPSEQ